MRWNRVEILLRGNKLNELNIIEKYVNNGVSVINLNNVRHEDSSDFHKHDRLYNCKGHIEDCKYSKIVEIYCSLKEPNDLFNLNTTMLSFGCVEWKNIEQVNFHISVMVEYFPPHLIPTYIRAWKQVIPTLDKVTIYGVNSLMKCDCRMIDMSVIFK